MFGNLELMIATTAANTWEKEGEKDWAWMIERANSPLKIVKLKT